MKFQTNQSQLIDALKSMRLPRVSAIPILGHVLIEADPKKLRLTTTNMEARITLDVDADISSPGALTLPLDRLSAIVSRVTRDEIAIGANGKNIAEIDGGSLTAKLYGLAAKEFPAASEVKPAIHKITCDGEELATAIRRAAVAMSVDKTRYVLNGVFVTEEDGKLWLVATDGHRCHVVTTEIDAPVHLRAIISSASIPPLLAILDRGEGPVNIMIRESWLVALMSRATLEARLIDGNFPNYKQAIPAPTKSQIVVPAADLISALDTTLGTQGDKGQVVVDFGKSGIRIASSAIEVGSTEATIDAPQKCDGKFCVSASYLRDALKSLAGEEARIDFNSEIDPLVLREPGFIGAVMPMRTQ